jgi:hypothetical protein
VVSNTELALKDLIKEHYDDLAPWDQNYFNWNYNLEHLMSQFCSTAKVHKQNMVYLTAFIGPLLIDAPTFMNNISLLAGSILNLYKSYFVISCWSAIANLLATDIRYGG